MKEGVGECVPSRDRRRALPGGLETLPDGRGSVVEILDPAATTAFRHLEYHTHSFGRSPFASARTRLRAEEPARNGE